MTIFRLLLAVMIALMPFNHIRIMFYRFFFGYDIDASSQVAALTLLIARKVRMRSAQIGPLNLIRIDMLEMAPLSMMGKLNFFSRVRRLVLDEEAYILHRNFIGGTYGTDVACGREDLHVGTNSQISIGCFIDLSDYITLGRNVVVGGARTQFWTHGFDHLRRRSSAPIVIADNVFIGSASLIVPGVTICSDVVVGAGSVVHRSITEAGMYASSHLRKIH